MTPLTLSAAMLRLPVVDSALEGFRITRERPLAVAAWAGWLLAGAVLGDALLTAPGLQALHGLSQAPGAVSEAQVMEVGAAATRAWPLVLSLMAVSYAFAVVFFTAVQRAVFEPAAQGRTFYLRLGRDEGLQLALALLVLLSLLGYSLLLSAVVGAAISLAAAAGPVAGPPVQAFAVGLMAAALLYPAVRLSLAPAATFAARRLRLFDTWPLTRGLFWPLLGVYAVALLLTFVVYFLALVIVAALTSTLALASGGGVGAIRAMTQPDTSSLPALFSPPSLLAMVLGAAISAPIYVVTAAAGAAAYRRIAGGGAATVVA